MKAISILQPWPWLIVRPDITDPTLRAAALLNGEMKDIENRTWWTSVRGPVLIHAGKGCDKWDADDYEFLLADYGIALPSVVERLERGGIVGIAEIVDCVRSSDSPWFQGPYGFVLRNSRPLPFIPYRGQLGFFDVPDEVVEPAFRQLGLELRCPFA